ncbi:MAG: phosphatase PAP2 family protein [Parvibaculaceae bacterium]
MKKTNLVIALVIAVAALFAGPELSVSVAHADAITIKLDLKKVLPCPPQSAVAADAGFACTQAPDLQKRDYQGILDAQKNASAADKTLAIADAAYPNIAQFGRPLWASIATASCKINPDVLAAKDDKELVKLLPDTLALFHAMTDASKSISNGAKKTFNRTRPFAISVAGLPQIVPLLPVENLKDSPSYPSGHTAFAYETAMVMAYIVPEEQDAIYARAAQYGHHRLVVGVHFPSDVEQGRVSGELIAAAFMEQDSFHALIAKAKPELRKLLCR